MLAGAKPNKTGFLDECPSTPAIRIEVKVPGMHKSTKKGK